MMTPQLPIPDPINYQAPAVQTVANQHSGSTEQLIREIFLRQLVDGSIKKNEAYGVRTGVAIEDLRSGRTLVGHNQDTEHFAASINKLPVALLILQDVRNGSLTMDQVMTWTAEDRRAGNGIFDQADSQLQAPLADVIHDLLNRSGNTAVRILVNNALGGAAAVNQRWAAEPNLAHTRLQPLDANRFFLGNSTTRESLWAMEQLLSERDEYSRFMKRAMAGNIFTDFGVRSQLQDGEWIVLVNKIGLLDDVEGNNRHDVGVIYNKRTKHSYGYSFFTTAPYSETDPSATQRADQSLKEMGRYLLRHAGARTMQAPPQALQQAPVEERVRY